jgi:hypothetical protein
VVGSRVYPGRVVALAERLRVSLCTSLRARRSRAFEGAGGRSLLLLLLLSLLGVSFAPGAEAQTSCSYAGATRLLAVSARSDVLAEVKRKGSEIVVGEYLEPPTRCSGGPKRLSTQNEPR